jgi:uncharacterized protein YbjT (DUF2867 family)
MHGQVHRYIKQNAPSWVVLRPTWFMQNFSEMQHRTTIVSEGAIYSATRDGQIPFIDAGDIAAVAAEALTSRSFPSSDRVLTGPQLLTYDHVAEIISSAAQYPVHHRRLSETELAQRLTANGMPASYAAFLASLDTQIASGSEAHLTEEVLQITLHATKTFEAFADEHRAAWARV